VLFGPSGPTLAPGLLPGSEVRVGARLATLP
jgi:hypothetical protein